MDYTYNIRGWLKEINKVDNMLQGTDPADLFAFKVNYDSREIANANVSELYNGNIAETFWKTNSDNNLRSYGYQYDALNRLDKAFYAKNNLVTNAYNEDVSYDKNGNITKLKRTGNMDSSTGMQIDDLFYFYTSSTPNQLEGVNDSTMHPEGFNGVGGVHQMEYDDNGNMRNDLNKDIENISYNHLNLPVTLTFGNGNTIKYLYDAAGVKTKKTVTTQGVAVTNDYLDGYHYEDGQMRFFPTAEGYVRLVYAKIVRFVYVFNYVDHLGNIRVSYSVDPSDNVLRITEENHYYPFGLKHKNYNVTKLKHEYVDESMFLQETAATGYNYKYNGKELQDELGLNVYDYGARNYDPAIGRWYNIDALAELAYDLTPNRYCFNNPIRFIDPSGLWEETSQGYSTNSKSDIERFMSYMDVETIALDNSPNNSQISTFIEGEMSPGGHGKTSYGRILADAIIVTSHKQIGGGFRLIASEESFSNFWHGVQRSLTPEALDTRTIGQNLLDLTYPGGDNPKKYNGKYDYSYVPMSLAEYPAIEHDRRYDRLGTSGASGLLGDTRAIGADWRFVGQELAIASMPIPIKQRIQAGILGIGLGLAALPKTLYQLSNQYNGGLGAVLVWDTVSGIGGANALSD